VLSGIALASVAPIIEPPLQKPLLNERGSNPINSNQFRPESNPVRQQVSRARPRQPNGRHKRISSAFDIDHCYATWGTNLIFNSNFNWNESSSLFQQSASDDSGIKRAWLKSIVVSMDVQFPSSSTDDHSTNQSWLYHIWIHSSGRNGNRPSPIRNSSSRLRYGRNRSTSGFLRRSLLRLRIRFQFSRFNSDAFRMIR